MRVQIYAVSLSVVVFLSFFSTLQAGAPSARMDDATRALDAQGARNESSSLDAHRAQGSQSRREARRANDNAPATCQLDLHAERLQPFYVMMLSGFVKTLGTAIVFKMDSLRPVQELREEWSRKDMKSQLKRLVGIGFQLLFALMAINTSFNDFTRLKRFASCTDSWWRIYTYYVSTVGTSTNLVAAYSIAPARFESLQVLAAAGTSSRDPRPFGFLLRVKFYLTLWYGRLLVQGMILVSLPAFLTHGIAGACMWLCFGFLSIWEVIKFFFWNLWNDLFTCSWGGLQKDAVDAFWFSYVYVMSAGSLALGTVSTVIVGWWHGKKILPRTFESWVFFADDVEVHGNLGDEPHEDLASLADDIGPDQEVGQEVGQANKLKYVWVFHTNAIASPAFWGVACFLAVRVYRWEGKNPMDIFYTAFYRTVHERTLAAYMHYLQTTLSGASASAMGAVSAAIDAFWALL